MRRPALAIISVTFVAGIVAAVFVAPSLVDRAMNRRMVEPPYAASDAARALHRTLTIADLHNDVLLWGRSIVDRSTHGHVDLPRLREANVTLAVFSTVTKTPRGINYIGNDSTTDQIALLGIVQRWPWRAIQSRLQRALFQSDRLRAASRASGGELRIGLTGRAIDLAVEAHRRNPRVIVAILSTEGLHALDGKLDNVDTLFAHGFRMAGITHFFDNDVGGSAHGREKGGLTPFGREVVQRMEKLRMIVDVAHASPKVIDDVLAMATRPVFVSHTGVQATCPGPRNLSDDQLRRIAATGGVIGIGFWDGAICTPSAANVAKAIKHAVDVAGIDHVGLGSDYDGATNEPFDVTGLVMITDELLKAGFDAEQIGKIMGGNTVRVLAQALP
jgi:membrane dipeptidase